MRGLVEPRQQVRVASLSQGRATRPIDVARASPQTQALAKTRNAVADEATSQTCREAAWAGKIDRRVR